MREGGTTHGGLDAEMAGNDDRIMIACCNDGTRPVIFKIERFDEPENDAERAWLESHDFSIKKEDAYTGA